MENQLSIPHKKFGWALDKLHIWYQNEQPFGPYSVDIYIPEWHLAIEVDGPYHSPKPDARRDERLLADFGLKVYRFPIKGGMSFERIQRFAEESIIDAAKDSVERKRVLNLA